MVSDLKWKTGIGWYSLILLGIFITLGLILSGIIRGIFLFLALTMTVYVGYNYYRWNGSPWRRVHFRGMLLFARVAGLETASSRSEGRPYNIVNSCKELAMTLCGPGKEMFVEAMISELLREKGSYFVKLLEEHRSMLFPELDEERFLDIKKITRNFDFGPKLVICNIIENTYGSSEAARYVKAVLTNEAF